MYSKVWKKQKIQFSEDTHLKDQPVDGVWVTLLSLFTTILTLSVL